MKLFEIDQMKLAAKMQAIIDDPNTNENVRAVAKTKLQQLADNNAGKTVTYAYTDFGATQKIKDYNKVFMVIDRTVITFRDMVDSIRKVNTTFVDFDNGTTDSKSPSIILKVKDDGNDVSDIIKNSIKSSKFTVSTVDKIDDNKYKAYIQ
jgi:TusA-related sulfurtransferase